MTKYLTNEELEFLKEKSKGLKVKDVYSLKPIDWDKVEVEFEKKCKEELGIDVRLVKEEEAKE